MAKIFLLEDDKALAEGLKYYLDKNGFETDTAGMAADAKKAIYANYDMLILDVSLPDGTGFEICEYVRACGNNIPIIFLTASDEEINIIRGLDIGGDDYITKPFKLGELHSRIKALLRRVSAKNNEIISGSLKIDTENGMVYKNGKALELTSAEYRLLLLLVKNKGKTVTRENILNTLWDNCGSFVDDNTLSVYVRRLREKLEEEPSSPVNLVTVRGFGYKWNEVTV